LIISVNVGVSRYGENLPKLMQHQDS
jgi:hypothetical protein